MLAILESQTAQAESRTIRDNALLHGPSRLLTQLALVQKCIHVHTHVHTPACPEFVRPGPEVVHRQRAIPTCDDQGALALVQRSIRDIVSVLLVGHNLHTDMISVHCRTLHARICGRCASHTIKPVRTHAHGHASTRPCAEVPADTQAWVTRFT